MEGPRCVNINIDMSKMLFLEAKEYQKNLIFVAFIFKNIFYLKKKKKKKIMII